MSGATKVCSNWSAFEMVHTKKRNQLHQQRMNDLVFVMYNLKLKRRQEKRASKSVIQQTLILDELQSDDEWIAETKEHVLPTGGEWLNELDRAARRFTKQATRDENESLYRELQDNVVEVQTLSDDDDHAEENEAAATFIGSNEIDFDDFGVVDDADIGGTTTRTDISDDVDGGSFGFDDY